MASWSAWQLPENPGVWESRDWVLESALPKGRPGKGVFGADPINGDCNANLQNGIIRLESPVINAPATMVSDYKLAFYHNVSTEFLWDGLNIKYKLNNGNWSILPQSAFLVNAYNASLNTSVQGNDNPMQGEPAFTGSDEGGYSGSWATSVVDLASLGFNENESIQFRFEVGTDGCNGAVGWYIDEIYVYSCSTALSVDSFSFLDENLTVTPNPSNGLFTLNNSKNIELEAVKIYDINGRIIKTIILNSSVTQQNIKLTDVASGVYFVKVTSAFNSKTFKLIKN